MKKIFAMVLALAMILSCAACGGSSKAKGGLLEEIKALNPEALDSIYGALTNIKTDYLPNCKL